MDKKFFQNRDGTNNEDCIRCYNVIKDYAEKHALTCTSECVDWASELHYGTYRDANSSPYIIHPLEVAHYLVMLNVKNAIYDMKLNELHDTNLAEQATLKDLDILLSVALMHDTLEDCKEKFSKLPKAVFEDIHSLYPEIYDYVVILTKDKTAPGYTLEGYFDEICNHWITLLVKIVDRTNNCSTIDSFDNKRMEKYVKETVKFFYPMSSQAKALYPDLSRIITIMKYFLVSVCETAASTLDIRDVIDGYPKDFEKTYIFIKGFSVGSSGHQNTLKALPLAKKYYANLVRKSGDPFIIHPLRVTSYLISLKIDNDIVLAASLLHEIIKKTHLEYNGIEIITKYHLNPRVLDYVRLLSNSEHYPLDMYYEAIKQNPDVLLIKLSNRANTCTVLIDSSDEEIKEYVEECENYIYPLCEYGIKHYPQYSYSIQIMYYHISSICNIVKSVKQI